MHAVLIGLAPVFLYVGLALLVVAALVRDRFTFAVFAAIAAGLFALHFFFVEEAPIWSAVWSHLGFLVVFLAVIVRVIYTNTTLGLPTEARSIFSAFSLMSGSEFRQLLSAGRIMTTEQPIFLTQEGVPVEYLYFILGGSVEIDKGGESTAMPSQIFIGEVSFITGEPASATVRAQAGARVLRWERDKLNAVMARTPALKLALLGHFNMDLARKVAAAPVA